MYLVPSRTICAAGAPEDEIEVTPAMEIAGARILCDNYDVGPPRLEACVAREVFLAMMRASRGLPRSADARPQRA